MMTDIEAKALALLNEVQADWNYQLGSLAFKRDRDVFSEAICRAIEQHEAFKQEVSDVMTYIKALYPTLPRNFDRFIIPKPDPLAQVLEDIGWSSDEEEVNNLRAGLEARGLEVREKGQ